MTVDKIIAVFFILGSGEIKPAVLGKYISLICPRHTAVFKTERGAFRHRKFNRISYGNIVLYYLTIGISNGNIYSTVRIIYIIIIAIYV